MRQVLIQNDPCRVVLSCIEEARRICYSGKDMQDKKIERTFLIAVLLGALFLVYLIFKPFLASLALAAVAAVIAYPLYRRLLALLSNRRTLAALVTVVISVVCLLIPVGIVGSRVAIEAGQLYQSLSASDGTEYLARMVQSVEDTMAFYGANVSFSESVTTDVDTYLKGALTWLLAHLGTAFSSAAAVFLNSLIFFIALFFLLRDGKTFREKVIELSPLADIDDETVFRRLHVAVNSVVKGSLSIALIQGTLATIGLLVFGVPNAILWGCVAAVAALIPGFGTALVIIPAVIFLYVDGSSGAALGLLAWGVVAVGLIDNFLGPKLVSSSMKLHPLFVLLAVLGGISFFGPIGIFLGPLSLSLLFALIYIYSDMVAPSTVQKSTIV